MAVTGKGPEGIELAAIAMSREQEPASTGDTCPACDGSGTQQKTCEQCRGGGCGSCANGYVTRTGRTCQPS